MYSRLKGYKVQNYFVFEVDMWGKMKSTKNVYFAFWPNFYLVKYKFDIADDVVLKFGLALKIFQEGRVNYFQAFIVDGKGMRLYVIDPEKETDPIQI